MNSTPAVVTQNERVFQNMFGTVSSDTFTLEKLYQLYQNVRDVCSKKGTALSVAKALLIFGFDSSITLILGQLVHDKTSIFSWVKFLLYKIFYRKRFVQKNIKSRTEELFFDHVKDEVNVKVDEKNENLFQNTMSIFPIYLDIHGGSGYLDYIPFVHNWFIRNIESKVKEDLEKSTLKKTTTFYQDSNGNIIRPLNMFGSHNYIKLHNIVQRFFKVVASGHTRSRGILINGESGLGKSRSCDYLAASGCYGDIFLFNLNTSDNLPRPFCEILRTILRTKSKNSTIVYIDEVDKWLARHSTLTYQKLPALDKANVTEIEHANNEKRKLLDSLLDLLENNNYESGIVFIFCCNNFDTLFADIDQKHIASLKTRFVPLEFSRCDREEIRRFLHFFNENQVHQELKYPAEHIDQSVSTIPDDYSITYRFLDETLVLCGYDTLKLASMLLSRQNEKTYPQTPTWSFEPVKMTTPEPLQIDSSESKLIEKIEVIDEETIKQKESELAEIRKKQRDDAYDKVYDLISLHIDSYGCTKGGLDQLFELFTTAMNDPLIDDLEYIPPKQEFTLLIASIVCYKQDYCKYLVQRGANIFKEDGNGKNVLLEALNKTNLQFAEIFVDLVDNYGFDPKREGLYQVAWILSAPPSSVETFSMLKHFYELGYDYDKTIVIMRAENYSIFEYTTFSIYENMIKRQPSKNSSNILEFCFEHSKNMRAEKILYNLLPNFSYHSDRKDIIIEIIDDLVKRSPKKIDLNLKLPKETTVMMDNSSMIEYLDHNISIYKSSTFASVKELLIEKLGQV